MTMVTNNSITGVAKPNHCCCCCPVDVKPTATELQEGTYDDSRFSNSWALPLDGLDHLDYQCSAPGSTAAIGPRRAEDLDRWWWCGQWQFQRLRQLVPQRRARGRR